MLNIFKAKEFDLSPIYESWVNPPIFYGNPKKDMPVDDWLDRIKAGCVERKVPEAYWHEVGQYYMAPKAKEHFIEVEKTLHQVNGGKYHWNWKRFKATMKNMDLEWDTSATFVMVERGSEGSWPTRRPGPVKVLSETAVHAATTAFKSHHPPQSSSTVIRSTELKEAETHRPGPVKALSETAIHAATMAFKSRHPPQSSRVSPIVTTQMAAISTPLQPLPVATEPTPRAQGVTTESNVPMWLLDAYQAVNSFAAEHSRGISTATFTTAGTSLVSSVSQAMGAVSAGAGNLFKEQWVSGQSQAGPGRHGDQNVSPSATRAMIRGIVQRTIRHLPRVLINTTTGRLYSRAEQASAFETLPIFDKLVSSMTTRTDHTRIKHEVRQYFRYVMLSHRWEDNEPLFQHVRHVAVYDLEESPTHDKLRMFCKIVRDAGFHWAWSDTCCIDKSDHFVLQEALVAMFKWYQGSAMMIVFLRGVQSSSQLGALGKSIWNTRAWTLQEYVASEVIHFYTEDWTPYLGLRLWNHKESPKVISEMEEATGVSAPQLMALRPGLTSIREKLRLASTRQTTLVEDAAYSLLGILSVTGLPAIYGEGEASLGRLLAHVLAGSGDASILAWTGEAGSFNSCLPAHITVFNAPATSHLPSPIPNTEIEEVIATSHPLFDLDVALTLYDRLNELPAPWFTANRMKLPCIAFQLPPLASFRTRLGHVYRANTATFGMVKIKTRHDLSRMSTLYLVHPWLDTLLEREDKSSDVVPSHSLSTDGQDDDEVRRIGYEDEDSVGDEEISDNDNVSSLFELELPSRPVPTPTASMDRETRARRLVARLRRPYGALLLTPASMGGRATDYRRVAADSLIMVQFQEGVSLADVLDNIRTLDVL